MMHQNFKKGDIVRLTKYPQAVGMVTKSRPHMVFCTLMDGKSEHAFGKPDQITLLQGAAVRRARLVAAAEDIYAALKTQVWRYHDEDGNEITDFAERLRRFEESLIHNEKAAKFLFERNPKLNPHPDTVNNVHRQILEAIKRVEGEEVSNG